VGAKRYETAGDLFKRATEVAPKMGDAWIGLGLAYNKLGRYDEAAAAIQKQIDLDPYNKRAHGDLGLVFKNAGKTDEAIKAYARQTELNALDGSAFKELGSLYVDDGRDTDAIPVLEKALGLLPRDAWVPANLVTAYLETKQPEKAQQAVARVLERDPNAAVREYVGWQLAQHGIDLARAEELSRDAEKRFVDDLRGLETTKSVTATTLEYVERLGWTWDAIGWIDFQRGQYDEADGYLEAAWHLLGVPEIAYRLGQVCAKRDKLADAMSYYLTAEALNSAPPPDLVARVKKLAGGGDLPLMLKSARQSAAAERALMLGPSADTGVAYFLAIVDGTRKALDVTFLSGAEALRPLADGAVRKAVFPVLLRAGSPARVAVRVHVVCSAGVCRGGIESPLRARTDTQLPSSSQ